MFDSPKIERITSKELQVLIEAKRKINHRKDGFVRVQQIACGLLVLIAFMFLFYGYYIQTIIPVFLFYVS